MERATINGLEKVPLERHEEITRSKLEVDRLRESIEIVKNSGVDYKFEPLTQSLSEKAHIQKRSLKAL
ncbi:MAG: hypothetical protein ACK4LA_01300 [Aquificaceae bacterium]